jgi:hypothetical protein
MGSCSNFIQACKLQPQHLRVVASETQLVVDSNQGGSSKLTTRDGSRQGSFWLQPRATSLHKGTVAKHLAWFHVAGQACHDHDREDPCQPLRQWLCQARYAAVTAPREEEL